MHLRFSLLFFFQKIGACRLFISSTTEKQTNEKTSALFVTSTSDGASGKLDELSVVSCERLRSYSGGHEALLVVSYDG